jgi:hypothetical protein
MNYNEKVLTEQLYILRDFLFHYTSYRVLQQKFYELSKLGSQEFWICTLNAHYFQAINLWCMIFGSNNNETHWRKLGLPGELQPEILKATGMTENEYKNYWDSVIEWRNKYSAHRDPDFRESTPDLKLARTIVIAYENWVEENIDVIFSFSLEMYEINFKDELETTLKDVFTRQLIQ